MILMGVALSWADIANYKKANSQKALSAEGNICCMSAQKCKPLTLKLKSTEHYPKENLNEMNTETALDIGKSLSSFRY